MTKRCVDKGKVSEMAVSMRYSVREVAGKLGVSESTIRRWTKTYANALGLSAENREATLGRGEVEILRQIRSLTAQKLSIETISGMLSKAQEPVPSHKPEAEDQPMLKGYEPVKPPVEDPRLW